MERGLLSRYNEKRDFAVTAEPPGKLGKNKAKNLRFVIQLHEATRTHYDFRLEWDGVMKSWAVTRGPSYDPADKRLAVRTEDHPIAYNKFEGVIPLNQYGAGPVMIWDEGRWIPDDDPVKMEKKGHITFHIEGTRMHGHWHLVRMQGREKRENWLLIKGKDEHILSKADNDKFLTRENTSAVSGRTMAEIIAESGLPIKTRKGTAKKVTSKKDAGKKQSKKSKIKLPDLMEAYQAPELATLVDAPPSNSDWVHEIKYDGYRLMAFVAAGEVVLRTRGSQDWTHKFRPLAEALAQLRIENGVFDLEACVVDETGRTDFSALQKALSEQAAERIEGWVFDVLYLNGQDHTKKPLLERKDTLKEALRDAGPALHYSEHVESTANILTQACKIGAEGLVSKRKDSLYAARRTTDWVKSKCGLEQEFVIGGFMPAKDYSKAVGALLLGYYKDGSLVYAGKVGTGFTAKVAKDIYTHLSSLQTKDSPFKEKIERGRRDYIFVKPQKMCEISFMEWTADGHIRHGSFKGLREDKDPRSVREEIPVHVSDSKPKKKTARGKPVSDTPAVIRGVTISHPEREVFPGTGLTKLDVARYYDMVAPVMLPFARERLISLLRCTGGIGGECFFQRNPMKGMGPGIYGYKLTHKGSPHEYLYIKDEAGLIQLVQMGALEFHGWQSRVSEQGKPNQIIFDLDPDPSVPFEAVRLAAEDIRARLKKLDLVSFPRLSGGKGVHVVVPIEPDHNQDEVKEFARRFAEAMATEMPDVYVANMSKKRREGRIFIDFFRNDFSATAIVPFSVRAREGAPVAWPLTWTDLRKTNSASTYHLNEVTSAMVKKAEKICKEFLSTRQRLNL